MGKKIVHVEFPSKDVDRAEKFWEGFGGWSIESAGMEGTRLPDVPGRRLGRRGLPAAGRRCRGRSSTSAPTTSTPTWRRCASLGGEAGNKQPIPHVGWFARCKDTEGNPFSLFQSDESVAPPAVT